MAIKVIGIASSPRKNGNTDLLMKEALRGATDAGAEVEYVFSPDLKISPCTGCGYCEKKGECRIKDDFIQLMAKMLEADAIFFSTPIYFMAVSAWGKMVIDRCQTLWSIKYTLKKNTRDPEKQWAALTIAVGGSKSKKMFEAVNLTMKYFHDVLEIKKAEELYFAEVDERGAIKSHPTALRDAYEKGKSLVEAIKR